MTRSNQPQGVTKASDAEKCETHLPGPLPAPLAPLERWKDRLRGSSRGFSEADRT